MPANYHRPGTDYVPISRPNDKQFEIYTRNIKRPIPDEIYDQQFGRLIDITNELDIRIDGVQTGDLPGIGNVVNINKLLTLSALNVLSWTNVTGVNILDESIPGIKLIPQAITQRELADGGILTSKIQQKAITTDLLDDECVTTEKLEDESVTSEKIGSGAVGSDEIADGAVRATELSSDSVTTIKILDLNVTTSKIADGNVTTPKLEDSSVITAKVADGAITLPKLGNDVTATIKVAATKAEQIAGASNNVYTNPAVQQNHSSSLKFTCSFNGYDAGTNPPAYGYNVTSITQNIAGDYTLNFTVPFADSNYVVNITTGYVTNSNYYGSANIVSKSTTQLRFTVWGATTGSGVPIQGNSLIVCVSGSGLQ